MASKIILYSFLFLFSINAYSQSPWVNKKGSFYGQLSTTYLGYRSIVTDNLNEIVKTDFKSTDITTSLYVDYSLTNDLAIIINLPFKAVEHNNQSLSSLGDPSIKLKYQIVKDIPLSGYLGYTAALSKRESVLRTGYNEHAGELGLSIGKGQKKSFYYGGVGYRYRATIPNQVLVEFEYGYQFLVAKKTFYIMLHIDGVFNTSSIGDPEAGQANLFHNDGEFLSPGLKFSYNAFDDFWINIGAQSGVLVRNFGAAPTITFGLAYKFER